MFQMFIYVLCTKSNRSPQIRNVFNQNLFILLLTCFNIFRMKVFLACKHLVVFYLSLKVAINFSCLRNFPEPIFLTFSCGPRLLRSVTSIFPLLWSFYLCHTKHATIISWHDDPRSINSKFNGQNQNFWFELRFLRYSGRHLDILLCTVAITWPS